MKRYLQYRVEDFVWDQAFRQWVLSPTRETDARWQEWLASHPEKSALITQARELVEALRLQELPLSDEEIRYAVQRTISQSRKQAPALTAGHTTPPVIIPFYQRSWFRVAASILLVLGLSIWGWRADLPDQIGHLIRPGITYDNLIASQKHALTETVNRSDKVMPVKLSDGSLVLLKAGSRISHAAVFRGNKREVYLSGEAFFEVTKNPNQPFLIYANGLVTKVLGTSFLIRAYAKDPDVTVEVKTGRVAVFAQTDPEAGQKLRDRDLDGVVLMPNQKIVFEREPARLSKSLVENPQVLAGNTQAQQFTFDDTPLPVVFGRLERAYGVDIVYDEELLATCPLTAELTEQSLFEKLDVICRVIEAHYDVIDGQIVINSRGCKP
ncbi:FecR family protein [Spirosoma aerophilum]